MPRRGARFVMQIVDNSDTITFVSVNTKVELWKDNARLRKWRFPNRDNNWNYWAYEGSLDFADRLVLKNAHPKTEFRFEEETPERVTKIFDVSYAHKDHMKRYAFLKKSVSVTEDGQENTRWYYLVPYEISQEEVKRILSYSIDRNKSRPY